MTKITFSPLVDSISGKTGNMIFSSWKGQSYVKNLVTPANPQSAAQTVIRNGYSACAYLWGRIDNDVRAAWARVGKRNNLSGYNEWLRLNYQAIGPYWPDWLTPPNNDLHAFYTVAASKGVGVGEIYIEWTGPAWNDDSYIYAWGSRNAVIGMLLLSKLQHKVNLLSGTIQTPYTNGNIYFHLAIHDPVTGLFSQSRKMLSQVGPA